MRQIHRTALAISVLVVASVQLAAQQTSSIRVKNLMTAEQFREAGLHKLTVDEPAALDSWFASTLTVLSARLSPPRLPNAGRALDFSNLEGAVIVAEDGQFLGKITTNLIDSQSIGNQIARYGSNISSTSIFNEIGLHRTVGRDEPTCAVRLSSLEG